MSQNTVNKAEFTRMHHKRCGGTLNTRQLADMLGVSNRAICAYLLNEICPSSTYTAKRVSGSLPEDMIHDMANAGIRIADIAHFYTVSPQRIAYIIKKKGVPTQ